MSASTEFEITRCRQDQQSSAGGCSVFLRFSITGPPGTHAVNVSIPKSNGQSPRLKHDRQLNIEQGATGYLDVTLEFDRKALDSCMLSIAVGRHPLARFVVRPPGGEPSPAQ